MRRSSRWSDATAPGVVRRIVRDAPRRVVRAIRRRLRTSDDTGSAALEFIAVGVLLLVPLAYLVVALGVVQGQALGVQTGARFVARVLAMSPDEVAATGGGDAVMASIIDEYGLDPDAVDVTLQCRPATPACPAAGATVIVTVSTRASLPFVPPFLGLDRIASVPVEASSAQKVSRFWESG